MEALKPFTYLFINALTLLCPLLLGNDKKTPYNTHWKNVLPGIALVAVAFIAWDSVFVRHRVWGFNPDYVTGITIGNLPLEEILFFITVPYACMFIYVLMRYRFGENFFPASRYVLSALAIVLIVFGFLNIERYYTSVNFIACGIVIFFHQAVLGSKYSGVFLLAYGVHLVPFFVINGILTSLPVVWYNDDFNLGFRLYTIPFEDLFYSMTLVLANVTLFESASKAQSR